MAYSLQKRHRLYYENKQSYQKYRLLGADICGGLSEEDGGTDSDQILNYRSIKAIAEAILQHQDSDSGY